MSWRSVRSVRIRRHRVEVDPVCQIEKDQLDNLVVELETVESIAKSAYQSAKNLSKQALCVGKLELTLTNDLTNYARIFTNDDTMSNLLEECNAYAYTSNTSSNEFATSLKKTLLDPLELLKRALTEVRRELRVYYSLEMEVIKLQRKVASYSDKERTGSNLVKFQEMKLALAVRKNEFTKLTQQLVAKVSKFVAGTKELLNSCVKGFIAAEMAWMNSCERTISRKSFMNIPVGIETDRLKFMGDSIRALESLSICLDSR
uniref:Uncharacterized protein n=1 Tax=Aceria tosichella TaxID=561515 RepID=A0A6G1SN28_9ACAR